MKGWKDGEKREGIRAGKRREGNKGGKMVGNRGKGKDGRGQRVRRGKR